MTAQHPPKIFRPLLGLCTLGLLLFVAAGCDGPKTSGESHFGTNKAFLRVCEDGICDAGDSCACAVCTVSCDEVSDCAARIFGAGAGADDLPENVVCRVPACLADPGDDGDDGGAGALCDVTCEVDTDCEFLDEFDAESDLPHVCQDGSCRTLDEPTSPAATEDMMSLCATGRALVPGEFTGNGFGFCLDEREVTVSAFRACVDAGECSAPDSGNFLTASRDEHPIQFVSLAQAETYCSYVHGRLPTQEEWQAASQNSGVPSDFPWGGQTPEATDSPSYVCGLNLTDTCVSGSFPAGSGPHGHLDLAGNVAELVTTADGVCAAGGAYDSLANALMTTSCADFAAPTATVGFRCQSSL